jgi:hypothetical protein
LDEAKPTAAKTVTEPTSSQIEDTATLVETSIMDEYPEVAAILADTPVAEKQVETVGETAA